jgi:hypothetical protein
MKFSFKLIKSLNLGYSGLLDWGYDVKCKTGDCCDDHLADEGMKSIRDKVNVTIKLN